MDIKWDPPDTIERWVGFARSAYKTQFWFELVKLLHAIRREDGLIPRHKLVELRDRLVESRLPCGYRQPCGVHAKRHSGAKQPKKIKDWRALVAKAKKQEQLDADWVYENLWHVPAAYRTGKQSEYSQEHFGVHPPGTGSDNDAPNGGAWGYLLWASQNLEKFYKMYQATVENRIRRADVKENNRKARDLRPAAEAKSAPREMPKAKPEQDVAPGLAMVEEMNRKLMKETDAADYL